MKTTRRVSILLTALGVGSLACCTDAVHAADDGTVDDRFRKLAERNREFAFGLAYGDYAAAPHMMFAGPTQKDGRIPVEEGARWHIGSLTKSFTASVIMRLVDRGMVSLDAPIGGYLGAQPNVHPDWQALTLRQLLSHTAGLPANASHRVILATLTAEPYQGRRTVLSGMWVRPLADKPGQFSYSNIGYVLAGIVAEEVSATPWEDLVWSEVAQPLGLTSLGFGAPIGTEDPRGHSSGFFRTEVISPSSIYADNPAWMGPAGTLHLTLRDLFTWGQIHIRALRGEIPRFLSADSCRQMQSKVAPEYGLGWIIDDQHDHIAWHNGSNTMWYAHLHMDTQKGTVVAAVTNTGDGDELDALVRSVLDQT